jgi:hypothetical protein
MQFLGVSGPSDTGGWGSISGRDMILGMLYIQEDGQKPLYLQLGSNHQKIKVRAV